MKLILVMHGETFGNANNIKDEHAEGAQLTKKGLKQSVKLGERLRDEKIDKIYVSDVLHAVETAIEIVNRHPKAKVFYEKALREQNFGHFTGKPQNYLRKESEKVGIPFVEFAPPDGESFNETRRRIWKFLNKVRKGNVKGTVLFVTHGGPIVSILLKILDKSFEEYDKYAPENTAVTVIELEEGGRKTVKTLNCTRHLQ